MASNRLTDVICRSAKYDLDGSKKLFDGGGLFMELMPTGSKKWRLKFRFNGKENRMSFGDYPLVSLAEAREKRDAAKKLLLEGIDPAQHRADSRRQQAIRSENLFSLIAEEWIGNKRDGWSEHHAGRIRNQLDREVCPDLGMRPISEITAPDLLAVIRRIEERGALETAKKTLQMCGQIFRYAVMTGRAERDPSGDLRGALRTRTVKNMTRINASELPELKRKIDTYHGQPVTRLALKLLALTFVRTVELRHAEWTEIDVEQAEWRIPADKMKMARPHIVPLSRQALEVIEELRGLTGGGRWLFPHSWHCHQPMSENTVLYAIYRMGYHSRMTGHGFRGLASTILNEKGFSSDWIERQLAHVEGNGVRAAYNHAQYLEGRRTMMQWWADHVEQEGRSNVIQFARK